MRRDKSVVWRVDYSRWSAHVSFDVEGTRNHIGTFAGTLSPTSLPQSPHAAVVADHSPFVTLVRHRTDVRLGAAVLIPAFDPGWLSQHRSARSIAMLVALAALAIVALLIASAAHRRGQRPGSRGIDDEELFTATPLPMSNEELARHTKSSHYAFGPLRLPRWLQVGSLVIALGMTWVVSQRIRPDRVRSRTSDTARVSGVRVGAADRVRDDGTESPEDLDLLPDSAPPFSFRAQDWIARDGGCEGRLEVTRGEPSSWALTARVHDDQGQLLDSARTRVASLETGDIVEFRFTHAACERIGAWDVRGDRRAP